MRTNAMQRRRRRGYTIVEVTIAGGLTVFLGVLLSSIWANLCGSTVDLIGRSRLVQEMNLAVASIGRDLGGSLAVPASSSLEGSTLEQGRWIGWQHPGDAELRLCFDAGAAPDGVCDWTGVSDTVIRYFLEADPNPATTTKILVREKQNDGTRFVAAKNLSAMTVDADGGFVRIVLTFKYRLRSGVDCFRTVTLKARPPQ